MIKLVTPLDESDVSRLKVGDVVYLNGLIFTSRDKTQLFLLNMIKKKIKLPVEFNGLVEYHAGPVVKKFGNEWKILSIGPTTSFRMEKYEGEFIEATGIRGIVGKGGMGKNTVEACKRKKVFYGLYPGGAGALAAKSIKKVEACYFLEELGIPEALWLLRVENFGPIIVAIDTNGNNIYDIVKKKNEK